VCSPCRDGQACPASSPCKNGSYSCSTGAELCIDTTNKSAGTACGPGQSCLNGRLTAAATCNASGQCPTPAVTDCASRVCRDATGCLVCQAGESVCGTACCAVGDGCCGGMCTGLGNRDNCGSCGNMCGLNQICNASRVCETQTWCSLQSRPSGVATADYQCLDFDTGMPPTNVWVPTVTGFGTLSLAIDDIKSVPNSLYANTPGVNTGEPANEAYAVWTAQGNFVSAVTLSLDAIPRQTHGASGGPVEYMCLSMGVIRGCIVYTLWAPTGVFTWALTFSNPNAPPSPSTPWYCEIAAVLDFNEWNHVDLKLTKDGVFTVGIDGVTSTCATNATINSGTTSVQLGAKGTPGEPQWGNIRYDNVVTYVQR
jgi:hypothetical protein